MLKLFIPVCSEADLMGVAMRLLRGDVMSQIDEVCRDLHRLSEWQLETVAELVREFLSEAEGDEPEAEPAENESQDKEGARGYWHELKYIRRGNKLHGPYLYKRWREGKVTRSQYEGKPRQSS